MLNYLSNNMLCATLVGLVALLLGYYLAKDSCNKKEHTH